MTSKFSRDYERECDVTNNVYADDGFARLLIECAESVTNDSGSTVEALEQAAQEMREFLSVSDKIPSGESRLVLVSRAMEIRNTAEIRAAIAECLRD